MAQDNPSIQLYLDLNIRYSITPNPIRKIFCNGKLTMKCDNGN